MLKAERKYQARVMNNEWNMLTSKQKQITTLKTQIASTNSFKPKKQYPRRHNKQNKRYCPNKIKLCWEPSLAKKKPLPHESNVKIINGSTWHYCTHHQAWARHTSESCLKAKSQQHRNDKQMANTKAKLHVASANLNIRNAIINSDCELE
jgi:regulator of replication initiation timing